MEVTIKIGKRDFKIGAVFLTALLLIGAASGTINLRDSGNFNVFTTLDLNGNSLKGIGSLNNCGPNQLIDGFGNCVDKNSMQNNLDMNSNQVENVASPDEASDAATKQYVDNNAASGGATFKAYKNGCGSASQVATWTEYTSTARYNYNLDSYARSPRNTDW